MIYNNINYWIVAPTKTKPCNPSPCGPNSICREVNDQAVCTCAPEYLGTPPLCRPECLISSDCPQNQACLNQKCRDPCIGTCGTQAICLVVNHNPVCSCPERYTGNPFIRCEISKKMNKIFKNSTDQYSCTKIWFFYTRDLLSKQRILKNIK